MTIEVDNYKLNFLRNSSSVCSGYLGLAAYSFSQVLLHVPPPSCAPYQPDLVGFPHEAQSPTTAFWYSSCTSCSFLGLDMVFPFLTVEVRFYLFGVSSSKAMEYPSAVFADTDGVGFGEGGLHTTSLVVKRWLLKHFLRLTPFLVVSTSVAALQWMHFMVAFQKNKWRRIYHIGFKTFVSSLLHILHPYVYIHKSTIHSSVCA